MDGLLLDTEVISLSTFVAACRNCSFEPDLQVYYRCIGTTFPRAQQILQQGYGKDFPLKVVVALWEKFYRQELDKKTPLKSGALSLLQYLDRKGMQKAVVTSTYKESAHRRLSNAGILSYFALVQCGDEIINGKPHPEIYLKACRKLGVAPAECLALEDSDNGVLSAHRAGLTIIQVPDVLEPSAKVKSLGHKILKSLAEVEEMLSSERNF
jgi:HAD superfamily hydrolase (TIGR01509 family)